MKPTTLYAIGRLLFGAAALTAPAPAGRALAGDGGAAPDAQAFLRGMGGREIGLGLGLLAMIRAGGPTRPWIIAGLLADSGDIAGSGTCHRQNGGLVWGWPAPRPQSAPPSWPQCLETDELQLVLPSLPNHPHGCIDIHDDAQCAGASLVRNGATVHRSSRSKPPMQRRPTVRKLLDTRRYASADAGEVAAVRCASRRDAGNHSEEYRTFRISTLCQPCRPTRQRSVCARCRSPV